MRRDDPDALAGPGDLTSLGLKTDSIGEVACAFLGYQRTKQISRKSRLSWEAGNAAPMRAEVRARAGEIVAGACLEIYREYLPLRAALGDRSVARVCDIGCGQGINDVFLLRDFAPRFTLVDIEETPEQYHQWAGAGAGYASLAAARDLLVENGADPGRVETVNPGRADWTPGAGAFDLVTSLYSCGFHYPVDEYLHVFLDTLETGGAVCLDLRRGYLRAGAPGVRRLMAAGAAAVVYEDAKSVRYLIAGRD